MSDYKKKITDISILGFGDISSAFLAALFWFILAAISHQSQYGEITYIISISTLLSTVSLLGASNVITVFEAKKYNLSFLYLCSIILSLICGIISSIILKNFTIILLPLGFVLFQLVTSKILGTKNYRKLTYLDRKSTRLNSSH